MSKKTIWSGAALLIAALFFVVHRLPIDGASDRAVVEVPRPRSESSPVTQTSAPVTASTDKRSSLNASVAPSKRISDRDPVGSEPAARAADGSTPADAYSNNVGAADETTDS